MINADAIKEIAGLALKAAGVTPIADHHGPTMFRCGDRIQEIVFPPPKREHEAQSLQGLLDLVADKAIAPEPEIFHARDCVTVLLNRKLRDESVTLRLDESQAMVAVLELTNSMRFKPRDLFRFMRTRLSRAGGGDELVAALQRIDFVRRSTSTAEVSRQRESLGRSIESSVQGVDKMPESFGLNFQMYRTPGVIWHSPVAVQVIFETELEEIALYVSPDSIEDAVEYVQGRLHDALLATGYPVFHAAP